MGDTNIQPGVLFRNYAAKEMREPAVSAVVVFTAG